MVSHSHNDPPTEAFLAGLNIAERSSAGSAVKFLAVAEGRADVYPRFGPTMEWDTAAGHAVLEAAGGKVATSTERRSATARSRRACAIRASSPGAPPSWPGLRAQATVW